MPNVITNIYSFQTVPCSNKLNGFTLCNAEHHLQKGFMGIPPQKKVEETSHRFCVMTFQNATRFSVSVDNFLLYNPINRHAPSDHLGKPDFLAGHKTLSANSFQTCKQCQNHFSCGLHN